MMEVFREGLKELLDVGQTRAEDSDRQQVTSIGKCSFWNSKLRDVAINLHQSAETHLRAVSEDECIRCQSRNTPQGVTVHSQLMSAI